MAKIIYTDDLPSGIGGRCKTPVFNFPFNLFGFGKCTIELRPKYKNDKGILNHELKHEEQFRNNAFHVYKYAFSKTYRLECELEAYAEQIKEYKYKNFNQCYWIVKVLHEKYKLKMSKEYLKNKVFEIWKREQVK